MEKLLAYLNFIKENHLEAVARESLRVTRSMDLPIMRLFMNIPDEVLLPQSMKSISDFAEQLSDGTFLEKQAENLQKWEDDQLEGGIKKDDIQPTDIVMIVAAQKKAFHKFIPLYTSDPQLIIDIIGELEELHTSAQDKSITMMFKWRKETELELLHANNFLDTVLENIPNMVFVKDAADLRFVRFNKAGEELLGYKRTDLIGKNDYDFFPKDQADFFTAKDRDVLDKGVLLDIKEEPVNTIEKGERWLHTKKLPVLDDNGKPVFLMGISEDITDHKKAEDELKKARDIFFKIFSLSPVATYITDVETGVFVYVNDEFEKIFKMKREDVVGKSVVELKILSAEEREKTSKKVRENNGSAKNLELQMRMGDGTKKDMYISSDIVEMDGRQRFIATMFDITERKLVEEKISILNSELNENIVQLNSVNKELEAFTYSVSHDLRAPLRAISGYSNMLEEDFGSKFNDEEKRLLEVIRYNAEKMGNLIDDLLDFSRLGRKEIDKKEENMNDLVEGVLIELGKSTSLQTEIKTGDLHNANVDYGLIHQVMINLVSNAIKYSSKAEKPKVEIKSEKSGNEIIYSVKDNGVGFDMKYSDKLFGVFSRLHGVEEFEGTGVGLAIVQRIVSKHHGRVWAEAAVDKGATFFIALPAT